MAALTRETQSDLAENWLQKHQNETLAICDWTMTEFASAMSLKLRSKQMSRLAYVAAHSEFEEWVKRQLTIFPIETDHFHHATAFCNDVASGLRAPDALQLAASFLVGGTLVTLDKPLFRAANMIGLWAELAQ